MEKRFRFLRLFATFYKVLGVITGLVVLLLILGACASSFIGSSMINQITQNYGYSYAGGAAGMAIFGLISGLMLLIMGGGLALTLFAVGEFVTLLIALEENTRATSLLLQHTLPVTYTPLASSVVQPYGNQILPAAE